MLIPTKYNVGHTFWVPRCVIEYSTEEMHFEGETWCREVKTHVGYAKQKRVIKIVASTTKGGAGIHIQYYVLNVEESENGQMSQVYSEANINDYTEEEAYNIAMEYQEQEKEYYGN
jgi:hypothetical protein